MPELVHMLHMRPDKFEDSDGLLLLAILIDVVSMNPYLYVHMPLIYISLAQYLTDWIYFTGQAVMVSLLLWSYFLASRQRVATNIILSTWLIFSVFTVIKFGMGDNSIPKIFEWGGLALAAVVVLYKLRKNGYV